MTMAVFSAQSRPPALRRLKPDIRGSVLRGFLRVLLLTFWMIFTFPFILWAMRQPREKRFPILRRFFGGVLKIIGISVVPHGEISKALPTLFVANHTSYLDVMALGALLPASFVSKAEVAQWPLFGPCARLQGTVFIERQRHLAAEHRDELRQRLEEPGNLVVFPEGTSSDGNRVFHFKSTLFSSVMPPLSNGGTVTVQPVSIVCTGMDGMPICRAFRSRYAWYGDMTFNRHLWQVLKTGRFRIDVIFHTAVPVLSFDGRKSLANYCFREVSQGVSDLLSGRIEKSVF